MALPVQNVDLTNCDREPIHVLGAVQSIGFLIALTSDWMIARASANVETWLGKGPEEILGRPLSEVLPAQAIHDLRNRTIMLRGPDSVERLFGVEILPGKPRIDIALHLSAGSVVIEGEPSSGEHQDSTTLSAR